MHCPSCGEEISEDSAFCRYCGEDVSFEGGEPDREPNREPPASQSSDGEESGRSVLKQVGYWGGRLGQIALVGVAGILILGSIIGNMNVISFAAIGIFALVLLALVGVLEFLIVKPLS